MEVDCEPLSGNGSPIHAIIQENGYCSVDWGDAHFEFPYNLIDGILNDVFNDCNWHRLGSYRNNPRGLGLYILTQEICCLHSPQFASAIASIMVKLDLIEFRQLFTKGRPIELKRK
jgi:hypothetical protein